jgi:hypothetical protein
LYEFQDLWDTGFTKLRVLDLLLAARYTCRFLLLELRDDDVAFIEPTCFVAGAKFVGQRPKLALFRRS